jgi:hypothetical protein
MKGQKIVSIITILACLFMLIAGVMGLRYVKRPEGHKDKGGRRGPGQYRHAERRHRISWNPSSADYESAARLRL